MTTRHTDGPELTRNARMLKAEMDRAARRREQADQEFGVAREQLVALHRATCERFGREVPADALLLDVLESVTVEDDDLWTWCGLRNNKGLATVRSRSLPGSETSLVRYLAIEFGVIAEEDQGILYPVDGNMHDVNPWHKVLRRSERPIGNVDRYKFAAGARA